MVRAELGTKRVCESCAAKFYDLNRDPIICPKCGAVFEIVAVDTVIPEASEQPKPKAEGNATDDSDDDDLDTGGHEVISLEDVEDDNSDEDVPDDIPDYEDDDISADDDDTFLETDDDDDADVSDLIGTDDRDDEN